MDKRASTSHMLSKLLSEFDALEGAQYCLDCGVNAVSRMNSHEEVLSKSEVLLRYPTFLLCFQKDTSLVLSTLDLS